jgi:hypothetical protein
VSREEIARIIEGACLDYQRGHTGKVATRPERRARAVSDAADAILAALRPTDTGWRDIAALEQLFDQISSLCMAFNDEIHNADDTLGQINQLTYAGIAALRPGTVRTGK